jgi:hypothetical protein
MALPLVKKHLVWYIQVYHGQPIFPLSVLQGGWGYFSILQKKNNEQSTNQLVSSFYYSTAIGHTSQLYGITTGENTSGISRITRVAILLVISIQ